MSDETTRYEPWTGPAIMLRETTEGGCFYPQEHKVSLAAALNNIMDAVEDLRREISALDDRVSELEGVVP